MKTNSKDILVQFRTDNELINKIDLECVKFGYCTRSQMIRTILINYFKGANKNEF